MAFHPSVLAPNPGQRQPILAVLEAALAAVDPFRAVQAALRREGNRLHAGPHTYDLEQFRRILVVGAGKAGAPMARAVEAVLEDYIADGLVVVKQGHGGPTRTVTIAEASHPMPDAAGVEAGRRILDLVQNATADDLIIALLSGGGSALLVAPAEGITLADKQAMTDALLASGASIDEINCLRKHCSAVKGGQLARAATPATTLTLALSDVVGSPLDVIASGPTVPDHATWSDAWSVVERYGLAAKLPAPIIDRLQAGQAGRIPDTPKPGDPAFARTRTVVVADNRVAAQAACTQAEKLGYHPLLLSTFMEGEAREVGRLLVALAREIRTSGHPVAPPACLVLGGETTVSLGATPGKGGRNQELALAAALELAGIEDVTVVSLATDGTDGPTDSAGALVDGTTVARGKSLSLDAEVHLHRHNAYPFLAAVNDMLWSGPTQTNVNDLMLVFVQG
jgi:glycerate 2-kinase